jgi:hypothetical protein
MNGWTDGSDERSYYRLAIAVLIISASKQSATMSPYIFIYLFIY